jgi:hypothetical protein
MRRSPLDLFEQPAQRVAVEFSDVWIQFSDVDIRISDFA